MKVSKVSKKCVAFLLSFTLVFSMFGTFVVTSAASEDDSYVVVKETDGTALSVGETWYDLDTSGVEAGTDFEATAYYIRSDVDANFKAWTRPSDTNFHTTGAYKLVTSDGVVTEGTANTSAFMTIPAGFEGWVLFEKAGFVNCWGGTQVISDYTIDEISQFGVYYSKMNNSQTGGLVVDTCAFVLDEEAFLDYSHSEAGTFRDVTFAKLSSESSFNEATEQWNLYPIPEVPARVPGTEGDTTFDAKYEINGVTYRGTFVRSDDTKGLCLKIPATSLPAGADDVLVTIKAGEYSPSGDTAGIRITEDFVLYLHDGNVSQYVGDAVCQTDCGEYVIEEADTVEIDGVT